MPAWSFFPTVTESGQERGAETVRLSSLCGPSGPSRPGVSLQSNPVPEDTL